MFPPQHTLGGRAQRSQPDGDAAIRQTDSDAALARYSAVRKQYFDDPFIKPLLSRGAHFQPPRPPLINVGTYVRSEGIDDLVNQWLALSAQEEKKCQIVSLGAGSDTRFWRIDVGPHKDNLAAYIEMDFAEITTKKAMAIKKSKDLSVPLGKPEDVKLTNGGTALHSPVYHLVPVDLRTPPHEALSSALRLKNSNELPLLDPSLPTLLLFECVLAYMLPSESSAIIQWFVDYVSTSNAGITLGGVVYEMFGLNDPFGKVMLHNLKARNVDLPGVEPYPTFASLPARFLDRGFGTSQAMTLREFRRFCISPEEHERISQLELLDELEELDLVLEHYAITWGLKIINGDGLKAKWNEWGLRPRTH